MKKFHDKYRIPSARAQWWDYSENATYFITICTAHRECYFGEITDSVMVLSDLGKIAEKYWLEIPAHFANVKLDAFVIMPNHFHGIISIEKMANHNDAVEKTTVVDMTVSGTHVVETHKLGVSTVTATEPKTVSGTDLATEPGIVTKSLTGKCGGKNDKWHKGVLGVVINQFKRRCTIDCRRINSCFCWQSRFYDNIIRNQESYITISEYINNNHNKWECDKFYPGTDRK